MHITYKDPSGQTDIQINIHM